MSNRIQVRRDTAANWTTTNPVLAAGEPALETDTGRRKTGDGSTAWTALPYVFDKTTADATYTTPAAANAAYAPITGSANYVAHGQLDAANATNISNPTSATGAALNAAYVAVPSVSAPAQTAGEWQSSSLMDMKIPSDASGRVRILQPTLASEGTRIQEPSMWWDGTRWNMTYTGTSTINYAHCEGDPTIPANWTKTGPILGTYSGTNYGGITTPANRSGVYIEGATTYLYYTDGTNVRVASIPSANLPSGTWTDMGVVCTPSGFPGNQFVIKDGSTYYLFCEQSYAGGAGWDTGIWTSTTPTGPFTVQILPIKSAAPITWNGASTSGAWVAKEGSTFVMFYHSAPYVGIPTAIYRATNTNLLADTWVIGNQGFPVVSRAAAYEVDQVADPFIAKSPGNVTYMVWDSIDNNGAPTQTGSITLAVMRPVRKLHDGTAWQSVDTHNDRNMDLLERFPAVTQIIPWMGDPTYHVGTWTAVADSTVPGGGYYQNTSAALNDAVGWDVLLQPGTYDLTVLFKPGTSSGQVSAFLGVPYAPSAGGWPSGNPLEGYAASPPAFGNKTWPTYTIYGTEVTRRQIILKVSGKNASSSGYLASIVGVQIRRLDR